MAYAFTTPVVSTGKGETSDMHVFTYSVVSCIDCQTLSHPCQYAEQICQVDHANASVKACQKHNKQAGPRFTKGLNEGS